MNNGLNNLPPGVSVNDIGDGENEYVECAMCEYPISDPEELDERGVCKCCRKWEEENE